MVQVTAGHGQLYAVRCIAVGSAGELRRLLASTDIMGLRKAANTCVFDMDMVTVIMGAVMPSEIRTWHDFGSMPGPLKASVLSAHRTSRVETVQDGKMSLSQGPLFYF